LKIAENVTYLFKEKGILGKIESAVENIAVQIEKGVHSITADVSHQWSGLTHESMDKSFRYYLRFPWEERLWEGYDCKVLTGGAAVSGTIFISDNYLSFAGEKKKERLVVCHCNSIIVIASTILFLIISLCFCCSSLCRCEILCPYNRQE